MRESLEMCCVVVIVALMLEGVACAVKEPNVVANNCVLKSSEIPAGYTANDCQCIKNPVAGRSESDDEWDRQHGRTPKGETYSHTGGTASGATDRVTRMVQPDHYASCHKYEQTIKPTSQLGRSCGISGTGVIHRCGDDDEG